ncbi:MAG TPA: ABC transporter permease, partial [Polyangia bacterium]|nr:ABC transporter permease [Polyangia bacterium]
MIGALATPTMACLAALLLFGLFVAITGRDPIAVYYQMYRGSFGTWFSFQNTLLRAAPLMLTALATALPLRLGLVVLGGEGSMVIGGLAAAAGAMAAHAHGPNGIKFVMLLSGAIVGGLWMSMAGALRAYRGVNETISTLLLNYIAIALLNHIVEGPLRDPASLNKPSTPPIGDDNMLGNLPGLDVHWGLAWGLAACV